MDKYHVHVYVVSALHEIDVEAENEEDAMRIAQDTYENGTEWLPFSAVDCKTIAIPFKNND